LDIIRPLWRVDSMEKFATGTYDKYIKALMDISQAITSDFYLEDILKLIVMVTAKVTGVEICSLWLIDEAETPKKIRLKATQALDPEYVKDRALQMNEGVVGYVASMNRPLIVENVLEEPRFKEKEMARKLGLVSMVSVPMHIKDDKVIGVLNCFTAEPHDFSETEVNLVTTVANQAALAIENTRLLVRTKVIEEELVTRKLIERAKDIVIVKKNLSADKAFRWLQKKSMDTRKSMREIAEALIISQDL
jgi:signal transduction protein with GAF and PtsI domain